MWTSGDRPAALFRAVLAILMAAALPAVGSAQDHSSVDCPHCEIEKFASCGGFLEGPNFDARGRLWVVDYLGGNVLTVADDGACSIVARTGGAANGARFGPDGRLYIADAKRGLLVLDPETMEINVWIDQLEGAPLLGANDLVFDAAGNLYVTVRGASTYLDPSGRVIVVPRGTTAPRVLARDLRFPNGVAVTPDGARLFVGLFSEKAILCINLDPATQEPQLSYVFVHTRAGVGPDGMMVDATGRLLWADFGGGAVSAADAAGRVLGSIRLGEGAGARVTNMTVHDNHLYVTEADRGEIWRMSLNAPLE